VRYTVKFEKSGGSDTFWSLTEKKFLVFEEDVRSIVSEYDIIEVRKSTRVSAFTIPLRKRIEIKSIEIDNLEERVMSALNKAPKAID
jgi:hypothetical protein